MQPNRKIGEKPDEMAGPLVRMDAGKLAKRAEVEKHQGRRKRGRPQLRWEDCVRRDMRRSGERRWKMERGGLPIEKYGKKEQKEWLDNTVTVPDPHPCTAENKEEELFIYAPRCGATFCPTHLRLDAVWAPDCHCDGNYACAQNVGAYTSS